MVANALSTRRAADRFVIASSVMLTFVSFWRASALILSDLGSSAYYVGGIAEKAVGKSGPWLILAIMLFSYAVRAVYIESCSMQVNREIAAPKLENLKRTGLVIFLYSLIFTSLVSFFAVMLIPDAERPRHFDNLIGGLSMFLVGPRSLRLAFHAFVVLVGALILAGAVKTSIMGANPRRSPPSLGSASLRRSSRRSPCRSGT